MELPRIGKVIGRMGQQVDFRLVLCILTRADQIRNTISGFPEDASEWVDTDGDGVGDNFDSFPDDPEKTERSEEALAGVFQIAIGGLVFVLTIVILSLSRRRADPGAGRPHKA